MKSNFELVIFGFFRGLSLLKTKLTPLLPIYKSENFREQGCVINIFL